MALTTLAMIAFAGNSLLCRVALKDAGIDPASFTTLRLISGAVTLWLLARTTARARSRGGNWPSAFALVVYAIGFSFAYVSLSAATGALLLFGAVQVTMIAHGLASGERLRGLQLVGFVLAFGGLIGLLLPGLSAPPLLGSVLMMSAGVAWGVYSLRGRGAGDPTRVTAGNFLRAVPIVVVVSVVLYARASVDVAGFWYAVGSGALASGIGYVIWYSVLPALRATSAASVQLSVPVIAAIGGIVLLGESITLRLVLASGAILGGIALVILERASVGGNRPAVVADAVAPRDTDRIHVVTMRVELDDLTRPEVRALLREHLANMHELSPPESIHALGLDGLRGPDVTFWTVWEGSTLLGCGALKELDGRHGEIKSMRTPVQHRRRGAARVVLAHIVREARARGYTRLSLETGSMDAFKPAQKLYESFGFKYCGPFGAYRLDPNSVFMSLELT